MPARTNSPKELRLITKEIRKDIVRSLAAASSGHTGGSLGLADVFACLYFSIMNYRADEPDWNYRPAMPPRPIRPCWQP